jgi:Holliday junction resolvasome RuvABC endonuclease subunit
MSKLLALDLSSNVGWAMFSPGAPPRFGTLAYEGQGKVRICGQFGDWLDDLYAVDPWQAMAWEAPFLKPGDKVDKIKILIGLVGVCFAFVGSQHHAMPHIEVQPKSVKKRMTGRQDADKADVIKACWSLGWKVGSDHEADAAGVGLVAYREIWPVHQARAT